ncbi:MAG TPA: hypothetical protein VMF86_12540 [Stellaceae bacterium]|nr:hypothetical protein [Stellaceae bacterium]
MLAALGAAVASSKASALTTYSTSPFRTIIAEATVPDRNDSKLYFSVRSGIVSHDGKPEITSADGIYYQSSGDAQITVGHRVMTLGSGDGLFMPANTRFSIRSQAGGEPAAYLLFLLSSDRQLRGGVAAGASVEVYRSPSPIPGLGRVRNLVSLSRVPVPPQSPLDPLHQRSGAALHYILSGVGAEFTEVRATQRGPGSISYEPRGFVYHWSNPGARPLVYLVFNISPNGLPPVLEVDGRSSDQSVAQAHVTLAIYCVVLSVILVLMIYVTTRSGLRHEIKISDHHDKS